MSVAGVMGISASVCHWCLLRISAAVSVTGLSGRSLASVSSVCHWFQLQVSVAGVSQLVSFTSHRLAG